MGAAIPSESQRSEFLLAMLRRLRATLALKLAEIDEVGMSIRLGVVSSDAAVEWLDDLGFLTLMDARDTRQDGTL